MHTAFSLFHYAWSFALIISVIVFIHEFGHYFAAKLCGVKVETFSIGFGRELFGVTDRSGTRWKLAVVPLGGFVKMYGDAGPASTPDNEALAEMTAEQKRRSFHYRPLWAKAIIVAAGPAANFILTIAVFTYFIFTIGIFSTEPVIGGIIPNTPAEAAGLKTGDRIVKVDQHDIKIFNDIPDALVTNLFTPVTLEILRDGKTIHATITPIESTEKDLTGNLQKRPLIGIRSEKITIENVGFVKAVWLATGETYHMCALNLHALGQMISGERSVKGLKGTLGIAKLSGDITKQGDTMSETLHILLSFIATISAGIGLFNILPLPLLDGGHLLFLAIEAVRGRPLAERVQEYSFRFGLAVIVMLMAFTFFNDTRQMIGDMHTADIKN